MTQQTDAERLQKIRRSIEAIKNIENPISAPYESDIEFLIDLLDDAENTIHDLIERCVLLGQKAIDSMKENIEITKLSTTLIELLNQKDTEIKQHEDTINAIVYAAYKLRQKSLYNTQTGEFTLNEIYFNQFKQKLKDYYVNPDVEVNDCEK